MVGRWVSPQGVVICSVHDFFSPDTVLNLTLFRIFHLSPLPFNALKLAMSSFFTKPFIFSWRTNPLTGMLLDLADINYLKTTLSNSSYFPALTFFLFRLIVRDKNTAIIFSLFAGKSHVEIVFLGTPYFPATNDLGFMFSISFNALNLSSVEVIFFCCFLLLWKMTSEFFLHCFKYETLHTSDKPQNIWIFQTFQFSRCSKRYLPLNYFELLPSFGSVKHLRLKWIICCFKQNYQSRLFRNMK